MNALEIMGVYESEIIAEFHPSLTRSYSYARAVFSVSWFVMNASQRAERVEI